MADDVNLLSLSLFFLMFSAVEIATGLSVLIYQYSATSNLTLDNFRSQRARD